MYNTAESRVVASFTVIVALLLGAWGALEGLLSRFSPLPDAFSDRTLERVLVTVVVVAVTAVAHQATGAATAAWARTLGGAAVMLGVLVSVAAVMHVFSAG